MAAKLNQRQARMVLGAVSGIGPVTIQRLLSHFRGDAAAILQASVLELSQVKGLNRKMQQALQAWKRLLIWARLSSGCKKSHLFCDATGRCLSRMFEVDSQSPRWALLAGHR